jgi:Cobalamin biosynthesis protein CobT VWA domain
MNDVTIAELRAGLQTSVEKIVNASGKAKFNPGGLQITVGGQQAQTIFKRGAADTLQAAIIYPAMPIDASIKRGEADRLTGYSLHEIGHILYTDIDMLKGAAACGTLTKELSNGIEDVRIENALVRTKGVGGARSCLSTLATSGLQKSFENGYDPNKVTNLPVTLAYLGREYTGFNVEGTDAIWEKLTPANRKWIESLLPRVAAVQSTYNAVELAKQVLREIPPPPQQPQESDSNEGKDGKDGNAKGNGKGQPKPQDKSDGKGGKSSGQPKPEQNQADEPTGSDGDGDEDGDEDAEDGDGNESNESNGSQAQGQGGVGYSPTGAGKDFDPTDTKGVVPSVDVRQSINDLAENVCKREGMDSYHQMSFGSTERQEHQPAYGHLPVYEALKHEAPAMGRVKNQLSQIIVAPEEGGWFGNQSAGRLDKRRLSDLPAGGENVFRRRWEKEGHESAVTLLLDGSSSMGCGNMRAAVGVAVSFAETLESMGVSFEACVFHNSFALSHGWKNQVYQDTNGSRRLDTRTSQLIDGTETVRLDIIKPRNKRLNQYRGTMGAAAQSAIGGTPDYAAIMGCADELLKRTERRKILFVITDGDGAGPSSIMKLVKLYKKLGVDIIGIGIKHDVSQQYELSMKVNNLSDLAGSAMKLLLKQFDKYKETVVTVR